MKTRNAVLGIALGLLVAGAGGILIRAVSANSHATGGGGGTAGESGGTAGESGGRPAPLPGGRGDAGSGGSARGLSGGQKGSEVGGRPLPGGNAVVVSPRLEFTNPLKFKTLQSLSDVILGNAWKVAMPFAIAFYLYAGYLYLTAFGKPEKVQQANSIFIYTSAGYGVIVLAHVIPVLIEGILNGIGAVL